MVLKFLSLFCVALFAITSESSGQYTLKMPYKRVGVENIKGSAVFKGIPTYGKPGQPNMPLYSVTFLIPPEINPKDISVSVENPVDSLLPGAWYIAPAYPPVKVDQRAPNGEYPKDMTVYGQNAFFPDSWTGKVTFGKLREDQLVQISINPCKYNPVTGEIKMLVGGVLTLSIKSQTGLKASTQSPLTAPARDSMTLKMLKSLIVNPDQLNDASQSIQAQPLGAVTASTLTYAIITTNEIVNAVSTTLNAFIGYLQSSGYNVWLATEDTWGGGIGNTAAENIRTWLKNVYQKYNVYYVLLIGNPDPVKGTVPMKITHPDQAKAGDTTGEAIPTDFYYAELSSNWDVNGNGHFGEYYDDFLAGGGDKYAEVNVGRIPYYGVSADLNKILQKSITYAQATSREWRKTILLPMVPWDPTTPMYHLGEQIKNNICISQQFGCYRIYDERYGDTVYKDIVNMYPPAEAVPCSEQNVMNAWMHNYFGAVTWSTHGWQQGAVDLFTSPDAIYLDDTHPSMTFQTSCNNASPEDSDNVAYSILRNGGITTVAATRMTIFWYGEMDFASSPSSGGLGYGYTAGIVGLSYCSGYALNKAKNMAASDWGSGGWRNFLIFNLYGCPEQSLNIPSDMPVAPTHLRVTSGAQNIFTLTWDENASNETGYCIESATSASGSFTQITVIGPNAYGTLISANPGDKRFFRVRAVNGTVFSCYSNIDSGTTYYNMAQGKTVTYSSQQTGNEAYKAVDGNASSTRWAASSGSMPQWLKVDLGISQTITGFEIVFERPGTSGDCNDFKIETSSNNTTWTTAVDCSNNTNTAQTQVYTYNGTARYARITISDAPGTYYASMYEFRVICNPVPPAPAWKSCNNAPDNQLYLEWQPATAATTYDVRRSTVSGGPYVTVSCASGITGTSLTTKNLIPGTTYYFVVAAVNSAGHSQNSVEFSAKSIATAPAAPTTLSAMPFSFDKIFLSWVDNSYTETKFYIEQAMSSSGPWSQIKSVGIDTTSCIVNGLSRNTTYYYRVRAYSSAGYSGYSNVSSATTFAWQATYEAENATLTGGAWKNTNHSGYSGTGFADGFYNNPTAQVSFIVNVSSAGIYDVKLHYSAGNGTSTNTGLYVNAAKIKNISCAATADWDTWSDESEIVTLNAGNNTIAYKAETASSSCINLDYIIVTYKGAQLEAENATLTGGAWKNTNHSGYSGTGFVDGFYNNATAQVSFTVNVPAAGSFKVTLRYSAGNGTSTNTGLYVNGTKIKNISCTATANWDTWANEQETVILNAGNNTIAYKAMTASTSCINLDYIMISQ